ncbi:MAG TPA: DUF433 domain-containing protein, partial [Pirellulales bacterium]|nr:DUF433 domain-containing protein [Pirellulales bacterium]
RNSSQDALPRALAPRPEIPVHGEPIHDDLLDNYPTLKPEHIRAALQYAAAVVGMDQSIYD